jgi:AcrR family transcriptional regulator
MEEFQRRRIGRPPLSGPEAESNPLNVLDHEGRRALFLIAAAGLFEEKGYANTSVEDIARKLGFTKGSFYYYWKNKQAIVQEIHDRGLRLINQRLDEVLAEEGSPAARLEEAIRGHIESVMHNRSVIAVLLGDFAFSEETLEGRRAYARRFQGLVEEGIAARVVRGLDPKVLTYAILGLCNSVARWYRPDGYLSAEQIRDMFAGFAAEGWRADRPGDAPEAASGDRDRSGP